ncbi:MAG: ATP-dependent protease subunit HslV [Planctomycetota bacterium]|nr:ATP-dependent protease subunit HslV [Planctomycetota bacterium]
MTTILAIHKDGASVLGGDGQVSLGQQVQKQGAVKVRSLQDGRILAGFAGGAADALALLERFEAKLDEHAGQLRKAAVELAKDWRTDRVLRRLEAVMVLADAQELLLVSGTGDVIAPDPEPAGGGVLATGSGGPVALAAARALLAHSSLSAKEVCEEALKVAAGIDLYSNEHITVHEVRS